MIYLITALAIVLLSNVAATSIVWQLDASRFVDIMAICQRLGEPSEVCSTAAQDAGLTGCLGAGVALVLVLLAGGRRNPAVTQSRTGGTSFVIVGLLVLLLAGYHLAKEISSPLPFFRGEVFYTQSTVVSLGNLLWPLILQLAAQADSTRWRIAHLTLLIPIISFSPFRGVIFAIVVFGLLVPLGVRAVEHLRKPGKRKAFGPIHAIAIVVPLLLILILSDTMQRTTNLHVANKSAVEQTGEKIAQRLAIPLFQAHQADASRLEPDVPSISDEILSKPRLRDSYGINQYLFAKTHDGLGEDTSLFFGEAALRSSSFPLIWIVVAPWILVLIWLGLRNVGVETSTLIAVAIWRASLGGLISILPALAIQLVLEMAIISLEKQGRNHVNVAGNT